MSWTQWTLGSTRTRSCSAYVSGRSFLLGLLVNLIFAVEIELLQILTYASFSCLTFVPSGCISNMRTGLNLELLPADDACLSVPEDDDQDPGLPAKLCGQVSQAGQFQG